MKTLRSLTTKRKNASDMTGEEKKEVQRKVIPAQDRGKVEEDPTVGWGTKLNKDIVYNDLPVRSKNIQTAERRRAEAFKKTMRTKHPVSGEVSPIKRSSNSVYRSGGTYNLDSELANYDRRQERVNDIKTVLEATKQEQRKKKK